MKASKQIHTLFLDIGGVLLTNGWDRKARQEAVKKFHLNEDAINERHAQYFDLYEMSKIDLNMYLDGVIFYEPRDFTKEQFKDFMFSCSQPLEGMLDFMKELKASKKLRVVALSNEGRELMLARIEKFKLTSLFDFFICSCFVGLKKPDPAIYRLALDLTQSNPKNVVYVDDRESLADAGRHHGMNVIHHVNKHETEKILREWVG